MRVDEALPREGPVGAVVLGGRGLLFLLLCCRCEMTKDWCVARFDQDLPYCRPIAVSDLHACGLHGYSIYGTVASPPQRMDAIARQLSSLTYNAGVRSSLA